jgi:hypothetical protein
MSLWVVFRIGIGKSLKEVFGNEYVLMCITFTLVLAYIVGFTSFNFGALVRFKIPFLPFYGITLALLYYYPEITARRRANTPH